GMLDYQKYPFWDRIMIQLIMRITKGPTDLNTKIEYTDWDQVDAFGKKICEW
ncbi:MAG: menaquinone-dependent protoporphyrinogen IX dehydrogenase, partial [Eudoraea sp.]|nr:menaquinone-dependent protoporphyrinogen IX dehydrogenase [Eudoraea sp.]NNK30712.1 menaquinone-dependent protoporphyrinogen IX dehydrogenase [Flavobacteriaceae bacterium]